MAAVCEKWYLSRWEYWSSLNCSAEGKLPCLAVRSPACVYCGGFAYFVLKRE